MMSAMASRIFFSSENDWMVGPDIWSLGVILLLLGFGITISSLEKNNKYKFFIFVRNIGSRIWLDGSSSLRTGCNVGK